MISKAELGRRIRQVRIEQGLTLKNLDEASGFSATHISEIERGKTSPTIGALIQIAAALGKEASFFIEENLLPETSEVRLENRVAAEVPGGRIETLSPGIPGGRLSAVMLRLSPATESVRLEAAEGEEGGFVVKGKVEMTVDSAVFELSQGDAIHHRADKVRTLRALGEAEAQVILIGTNRIPVPPRN